MFEFALGVIGGAVTVWAFQRVDRAAHRVELVRADATHVTLKPDATARRNGRTVAVTRVALRPGDQLLVASRDTTSHLDIKKENHP